MATRIIPAFEWLLHYQKGDLKNDLSAGLIVAIMLVPQGMAYAMLAGLPPVMGLYASTVPLLVYALFGSCRHLAVGPVAMISLLVFAGLSPLAKPGSDEYISLALLLSFMVGAIKLILGLSRMGFLVNFLSPAVISGFTSAAAIVIGLSQVHHLLGIPSQGGHSFLHLLQGVGSNVGKAHLPTLAIGAASVVFLLLFRKRAPHFPAPLAVVILGALLVQSLGPDQGGVKIVGHVPQGLPAFSIPPWEPEKMKDLLPIALTILFVSFMESIAVAKMIAGKEKYRVDSNQEFIGLGLANFVGSFFLSYPVTGGFSRTAINYQVGARTGLASLSAAALVILVLLVLTPLFFFLPKAVLAAIVLVAVLGLVDIREARHFFHLKRIDGWTLMATFAATLGLGAIQGILLGVALSLVVFIRRSAYPQVVELGYLEQEGVFRNLLRYPQARVYPEVLLLRIDSSLYFANLEFIKDSLQRKLDERPGVRRVIIDLSSVNDIDAPAIDALEEIMRKYEDRGIRFFFAGMKGPVRDLVAHAGWEEKYREAFQYPSLQSALKSIK
ncbi:MAG: solute carrier family 26 protein [Syntrophaceae bacterium]|nr:solute carrier family 26 protein [Syntrophaceae bacterium]